MIEGEDQCIERDTPQLIGLIDSRFTSSMTAILGRLRSVDGER